MTDARSDILQAVRSSLDLGEQRSASRVELVEKRISASEAHVQPLVEDPLIQRFCDKHAAVHGTYERVAGLAEVPSAILRHLTAKEMPIELLVGQGELLDTVLWPNDMSVEKRPATVEDSVAISEAYAGIAETGTLVLLSGEKRWTSHNFLPDDHIIILDSTLIVRHQEDIWARLRALPDGLPRVVNLITGPSKTADVEQTVQYGAHGPRRLHLIVVEG